MNFDTPPATMLNQQAIALFNQGQYAEAAAMYEQAIAAEPSETSHYWHLGLSLLLQGQEAEAQLTWMSAILEIDPEQAEQHTADLLQVLHTEAARQADASSYEAAWLIRQHIQEIDPEDIANLLQIVLLAISLQKFSEDSELSLVSQVLQESGLSETVSPDLLLEVLQRVVEIAPTHVTTLEFAAACFACIPDSESVLQVLIDRIVALNLINQFQLSAELSQFCLHLAPDNPRVLYTVAGALQDAEQNLASLPLLQQYLEQVESPIDKLNGIHMLVRGFVQAGGHWQEAYAAHETSKQLLASFNSDSNLELEAVLKLISIGSTLPYFEDAPASYRPLRNNFASLCQTSLQKNFQTQVHQYQQRSPSVLIADKRLKIGYLSECFRQHSVGWLVRWALECHDQSQFQVHLYSLRPTRDALQQKFADKFGSQFHDLPFSLLGITDQVYQDGIDVLVDLDSLTTNSGAALTLKPAPVQVSWLGFDASGLPAIDYYIADPYVLPEAAQNYYSETIWKLPQTYIAVSGFEVGVPTLRRDEMGIPTDAVIYFTSQSAYKFHPDHTRLQMKILKALPNSYFLIKSAKADLQLLQDSFEELAAAEGVSYDRLRFLPRVAGESIHRANLGLADVALDTYPYNGATTTLEMLWMGIPIVTRVGEQFAARNSYTMLMNVGVTEGIAWTPEEYVEWGIRLGKDANLRQQISCQLKQSRQTSPLWNARQFTRDLENAYRQMWQRYLATQ